MNILKTTHWERMLVICILAALTCSLVISSQLVDDNSRASIHSLTGGWFRYEGNRKVPVVLPCDITVPHGEDLELRYNRLTTSDGSRTICTKGAVYKLQMKLGNNVLYDYDDTGFKRNTQMRSKLDCMAILPENPSGTDLVLTYENQGNDVFHIEPVLVGRSGEILQRLWYNDIFLIVGIFTMSIIGVVCAGAYLYLKYLHIQDSRLSSAAVFLILVSIWSMMESSLTQQIKGQSPSICVLATYCFMALPIPAIHFVSKSAGLRKYRRLNFLLMLCYANILSQAALHILMGNDYVDMIWATNTIQVIVCVVVTHLLNREYTQTHNWELLAVLQAVFILDVAVTIEFIVYWVFESRYYGVVFQLGVLAFIIRLICAILVSMASNIQFKAEAMVYKRLSREDRLTGLGNRRAFDDYLDELKRNGFRGQNSMLFFLDVNGLKQVNDRYGHRAGDELIVGAARCLNHAFSEIGTCYRLGGDEFAVVVPNDRVPAEQCGQELEQAIASHNASNRWKLSIAWGVSYLRNQDGTPKRTSDWMFEADQAMYAMKSQMKAHEPESAGGKE